MPKDEAKSLFITYHKGHIPVMKHILFGGEKISLFLFFFFLFLWIIYWNFYYLWKKLWGCEIRFFFALLPVGYCSFFGINFAQSICEMKLNWANQRETISMMGGR
jgi:hypothetical protein